MRIGIFGGTFDPVHKGHLSLAQAAQKELGLAKVHFVLSPRSPFKLKQKSAPVSARLHMLRAAVKGQKAFAAADWEVKRKGPSYTIDTVRSYRRKHPTHQIFLIVGSDALSDFRKWKNWKEILDSANLVVGRRPGSALKIPSLLVPHVWVLNGTFPNVSSTQLRRSLRRKKRSRHIPAPVESLLYKWNLYA